MAEISSSRVLSARGTHLVERDPVLHPVAECLEADLGKVRKVRIELLFGLAGCEEASIPILQGLGQVPVEECDEGCDPRFHKLVNLRYLSLRAPFFAYSTHESRVPLQAFPVDGITSTAERDDARPRHGEPVAVRAIGLEEFDIIV